MSDDDDLFEEIKWVIKIKNKLEILDVIMDFVFFIYDFIFEKLDSDEVVVCFENFLSDFKNVILLVCLYFVGFVI